MSSTKFVFFGPIGKTRWPSWPLIGWDIFDFSSATAERNSTNFDMKQDLNVLYQVCIFGPIRKTRWPPWPLIGWDIFNFSSETAEQNSTILDRKQDLNVLYQVCVFGPIGKTRWPPWPLIGWDIFDFSSETAERNSTKLHRKQDLNVLYHFYTPVFRRDVLWYGDVRPGLRPSVRLSVRPVSVRPVSVRPFPHFSPTCFDILSWNFAHDFVLMNYRSSSTVVTLRQFLKELCLFVNLE